MKPAASYVRCGVAPITLKPEDLGCTASLFPFFLFSLLSAVDKGGRRPMLGMTMQTVGKKLFLSDSLLPQGPHLLSLSFLGMRIKPCLLWCLSSPLTNNAVFQHREMSRAQQKQG